MERVLLVSNAAAGGVSARKKEVIAKALSADFKLDLADTAGRGHATELACMAVEDGFDAVVAFGGDGTLNELAQALVSTDIALGILPGGSTNVLGRTLGIPSEPIEATALLAKRLRARKRHRVNVGRIGDRFFLFAAGMGLDAEVARRVEARPEAKRKWGEWAWLKQALHTALADYRGADRSISLRVGGEEPDRVVSVVFANARPFTYFGRWPVDVCPEAALDDGLDLLAVTDIRVRMVPRIFWSVFVTRSHTRWRTTRYDHDLDHVTLIADEPAPVQVDGDFVGETRHAEVTSVRDALDLVI